MADCTIIDKLNYILETKDLIKTALETQDIEVLESDTFRKYSEYITEIRKVASVNGETGDIILKSINGQNLVGEGDIVIQGGGGGSVTAGVNKIIMGEEDYGWNSYTGDVKLTNGWIDLDDDGVQETYDIRVGNGEGSAMWFGFNSTDNSIKIEDNGSRLSFTVNPDILGGNVDLSDYYTKGEVYNKNEVNELIDEVNAGDVDLTNYYTKQEVDNKIPSLNGYATEQWVEDKNYLTEHQSLEDYAKKSDIPDVSEFIKEIPSEYITEEELNGKGYLTSIPDTYITDGELSTAISDKVSQNALNEAIEGVENKIPSLDGYATEQWVEDKKYLTEHQSLEDYAKKSDIPTIPTSNTAFTNDAGFITLNEVPETDLSNYYTKEQTYSKDEVDGLLENSGGGTAGVEAINVGKDAQDWTQKTGVVSFYTDWYDGSYDVAIGGMSFFGVKPIDNSIILENAGGTVNGNTRCGIKINTDNFKTINGESIFGEGNITIEGGSGSVKVVELTQAEYDSLEIKEEGVIYVITDATEATIPTKLSELENDKGYITSIPDEYITDTELNNKNYVTDTELTTTIAPLILNVTQLDNSVEVEKYGNLKNYIYYKTINGESILGDGNIEIKGGGGSVNIIELTQAEYDALTSYDDDTFYAITDADKQYVIQSDLSNYYTKSEIDAILGNVSSKITEINNLI